MIGLSLGPRTAFFALLVALAGCAGSGLLGHGSAPQSMMPQTGAAHPAVGYTYEFKNATNENISWHRLGENCMKENVPNVSDVKPGQTLKYAVNTNTGCCRCSHETSWFVLQYRTPNGDYRDVGFDKPLGRDWEISNRGVKGDLYFCRQLGGASIKGEMIRGNKCT